MRCAATQYSLTPHIGRIESGLTLVDLGELA
jgi:hypothetical protein